MIALRSRAGTWRRSPEGRRAAEVRARAAQPPDVRLRRIHPTIRAGAERTEMISHAAEPWAGGPASRHDTGTRTPPRPPSAQWAPPRRQPRERAAPRGAPPLPRWRHAPRARAAPPASRRTPRARRSPRARHTPRARRSPRERPLPAAAPLRRGAPRSPSAPLPRGAPAPRDAPAPQAPRPREPPRSVASAPTLPERPAPRERAPPPRARPAPRAPRSPSAPLPASAPRPERARVVTDGDGGVSARSVPTSADAVLPTRPRRRRRSRDRVRPSQRGHALLSGAIRAGGHRARQRADRHEPGKGSILEALAAPTSIPARPTGRG